MSDDIQLNSFSNALDGLDFTSEESKPQKKVIFNTASTNDYMSNEAYKTLRTNLIFCGTDIKSVIITSCGENEGKSTISIELTKSLAEGGKKTLLIDADMRKSAMLKRNSRTSGVEGLSEALSGIVDVEDVVYKTQHENFDVIFSGHFPPNPVELISNGKFEEILKKFKERYDYIIVDSPPLGMVIDAAVIASYCDGAILVLADRKVPRKSAIEVKEQLEKSNCRILGAVINETDKKTARYYKKYYNKSYRYGE